MAAANTRSFLTPNVSQNRRDIRNVNKITAGVVENKRNRYCNILINMQ